MTKDYYIRFSESEYMEIPAKFRSRATFIDNDYESYKEDPMFKAIYAKYKKIKKELETYKFNKRHG